MEPCFDPELALALFSPLDATPKISMNAALLIEFPETSQILSAARMVAGALPFAALPPAVAAPLAAKAHKSKKHGKDKRRKSKKQKKSSTSGSSTSGSSSSSIAAVPAPRDRKPMFYKRSALPQGSGTYRMLPTAVMKEILHVISPETCTRDEKAGNSPPDFCWYPKNLLWHIGFWSAQNKQKVFMFCFVINKN
jgi:hypothetical protein